MDRIDSRAGAKLFEFLSITVELMELGDAWMYIVTRQRLLLNNFLRLSIFELSFCSNSSWNTLFPTRKFVRVKRNWRNDLSLLQKNLRNEDSYSFSFFFLLRIIIVLEEHVCNVWTAPCVPTHRSLRGSSMLVYAVVCQPSVPCNFIKFPDIRFKGQRDRLEWENI